ncbi:hypothetical protein KFL_004680010 [Klebsormidium nitens]|uniref:Uncharacterized protein n=1 Tax=Klebsormidium nitens TaxID=105231 RepID=A0A1Y1IJT4_KLENI|nr:hypothetical protein KFL_004680010 [Klebsormidium nitens]|eukprot:GAQ88897.1 hypothetical protein KFL_004680010 [Klebsormidium nitens]
MGGGTVPPEDGLGEEHQRTIAFLYGVCDAAAFPRTGVDFSKLREDYRQVDEELNGLQHTKSLVSSFAEHIEIVLQMKQAAQRHQELEQSTQELVERCDRLSEGLRSVASLLPAVLLQHAPGARRAMDLAWNRLRSLGTQIQGTAAAHRAVGQDLQSLAERAQAVVRDPSKADIGVAAAPAMGGGAGALAVLVLRGVLGPWALPASAVAGALGAVGASVLSEQTLHPEARTTFALLQNKLELMSGLVRSKASVLDVLASNLQAAAGQLMAVNDIALDGSDDACTLLQEGVAACELSLRSVESTCEVCNYTSSAFMAVVAD